jgi:hypothetical protein
MIVGVAPAPPDDDGDARNYPESGETIRMAREIVHGGLWIAPTTGGWSMTRF